MFKLKVVNVSSPYVPNQIKFNGNRTSDSREEDIFISQYIFIMSPSNIDPSKREWPFKCLDLWSQRAAIVLDLNVIEGKAFILI